MVNVLLIATISGVDSKTLDELKTHTPGFNRGFYNSHTLKQPCYEGRQIINMDFKTGLGTARNMICDQNNVGKLGEPYAYNRDENGEWRPIAP